MGEMKAAIWRHTRIYGTGDWRGLTRQPADLALNSGRALRAKALNPPLKLAPTKAPSARWVVPIGAHAHHDN
jgi:hypothetical protein